MNHFMDFDPYLISALNEGLRQEVSTRRLEKRLRQQRRPSASRLVAFASRSTLPLRRRVGLAG